MESADWIAQILIFGWPVFILIINTIVLVLTKEPRKDANGQVRRPKSIFASKKIIGYAAAFFLPINFALTFLVILILGENPSSGDGFYFTDGFAGFIDFLVSLLIFGGLFIGLYLLGLILGVIGVVIIYFEEKDRRYTMIAWVGLLSHVLCLVYLPIAGTVFATLSEQEIHNEQKPDTIFERAVDKKYVDLSGKSLTSVKVLENLTQLEELDLNNNQLTDVKGLENLAQLKDLDLHNNKLTSVKGLENLTKLDLLFLSDNQLTDVKGLENLTQLKVLTLQDNPDLTKSQIDELKKLLPNCDITHNAK